MNKNAAGEQPFQFAPECIRVDETTLGVACEGCPYLTDDCAFLAAGQLALRASQAEEDLAAERQARIEDNHDKVIPGFLNTNGMDARIKTDTELAAQILAGNVALVRIDVRGLKATNDEWGDALGDVILQETGRRLQFGSRGVRLGQSHHTAPGVERRQKGSESFDIGFRGEKADELNLLLRDVTYEETEAIVGRLQQRFSLEDAIKDGTAPHPQVPIPASFSWVHGSEINQSPEDDTVQSVFARMYETARQRHEGLKEQQYEEMWRLICRARGEAVTPLPENMDHRLLYHDFITSCCAPYYEGAETILTDIQKHYGEALANEAALQDLFDLIKQVVKEHGITHLSSDESDKIKEIYNENELPPHYVLPLSSLIKARDLDIRRSLEIDDPYFWFNAQLVIYPGYSEAYVDNSSNTSMRDWPETVVLSLRWDGRRRLHRHQFMIVAPDNDTPITGAREYYPAEIGGGEPTPFERALTLSEVALLHQWVGTIFSRLQPPSINV